MEVNMDPLQKQQLDDTFDAFTMLSGGSIVSLMHVEGGYTRYTANAVELLGLPGEYIPNGAMNWNDYLHPEDRKRYMDVMGPLISGESMTYDLTYRVRAASGEYVNFRAVGAVLRGSDGKPNLIGGVMLNQGLTENTDPVTVLPNKNALEETLTRRMQQEESLILLQVGVRRFSEINQIHGYTYGNRLLQEIAWILQETVEDRAEVYRLDGASFALLFRSITREEVSAIYDHIRYTLQRGVEVNGIRSILSASAGLISVYNAESSADNICACLNYAYRESKRHNGEPVDFNGSIHQEGVEMLERINAIRDSIMDGCRGFHMEYEPVASAKDDWMNGAEGSVYWEDARFGKVSAGEFLPILEHDFVFEELGEFVLRQSLEDGVRFLERDPDFLLCIDVYRMQLESDFFLDDLFHGLEKTGFPAKQLSLNFMGDYRSMDPERCSRIIETLHQRGILVVMDGFGSGSDSIEFMKNISVDGVSIDIRFVRGIETDTRGRSILTHLTELAADCVKYINVKGIDNQQLRNIMRSLPVTTLQGRFFSGPVPAQEVVDRVHKGVFHTNPC